MDLCGISLKGIGLALTATPWGLALTALAGIVAVGVLAYTQWDSVKGIIQGAVDLGAAPKREAEMVADKKQVAYDLSAGRISAKDAQAKIASIDGEYKKREALIKNGFEDPGKKRAGPDANLVGDITQQLQAQLQQVTLPPEVLAALRDGKVEVNVAPGVEATVKKGGKTKGVPHKAVVNT